MRRAIAFIVLLALVSFGSWLLVGREVLPRSGTSAHGRDGGSTGSVASTVEPPLPAFASEPARAAAKSERQAMHRRILEAVEAREHAAGPHEHNDAEGGRSPGSAIAGPDDAPPTPGNLTDRTGNHGYLVKVMNEDLMPLADECYALARHSNPSLAGMLVLDFAFIGDEEIGGVVESVELGASNELLDPGLLECMRESILAITLPPPEHDGRDAISLSIPLSPENVE
jgi:hypothetical protein